MKKFSSVLLIVAVMLFTGSLVFGQQVQLRGSGILYKPNGAAATGSDESGLNSVDWDSGNGFDIQGIYWLKDSPWGFGASIGKATWEIDEYDEMQSSGGYIFGDGLEGDADLTIFGVSVFRQLSELFSKSEESKLGFVGEIGIRSISVDSNIDGTTGIIASGGMMIWNQSLEFEDGVVGLVALDVEYAVQENIKLFVQGGYQFDLQKGEVERDVPGLGTYVAGETELQAAYAKAGIAVSF